MGNVEIPKWLKGLPLAPEFRPTDTEFADPIAYISKIEKEAAAYGICKIIPPLPKPSKKYVFNNLNRSLSKCPELGSDADVSKNVSSVSSCGDSGAEEGEGRAVFTTRQQELGQSGKKVRGALNGQQCGVQKQVWQSGEVYTLEQFESKSKTFAKGMLSVLKEVSPLHIEALFWKLASEKPIYVEYANDVPGSGFGEPEGQFRYFHRRRRRRKRMSYRRESSDCKKDEIDTITNSHIHESKDTSVKSDPDICLEAPKSSTTSSNLVSDENSHSKRKCGNGSNDAEGTAGWKLSNSPWNLQVIARSAGSLTRFMPDDIPGVTSPMVYIGMLFSWFAWHVEDHELHSMNFLHTGSSKTWYAVPGDYAFTFEEVICTEACGGNIDRLAALSLLGEKTTLLSPELIVASGIPCCRLIQNPGEFVVTFPRAYHVGFSHGFNCGEAANFGTSQWLEVAKEAAVRRAAMNYLPMLSHQQLLYLLTMSFVSRVPRSLLPGARSSRLKDRLKEEREVLVKNAFIGDMLTENKLLSLLLKRGSTYRAIVWHPDLLPYTSKDPEFPSGTDEVSTILHENVIDIRSESNTNQNSLLDEMSLYMENVNYLYLNDDDLSCDFQVDSGTLACVACGILGYPFMSVLQPYEGATMEFLPVDHPLDQDPTVLEPKNVHYCPDLDHPVDGSVSDNLHRVADVPLPSKDAPSPSITKFPEGWDTSNKCLRPRIFCLEHAVQVEELLQSKGGAKVVVICHSDYQKIKAHAIPVAEDIGIPFNYDDVPLDAASQEDLNLINLAIDDEHDENGEDWTSKLGLNLRYCVKIRKNSPLKQVQHALPLGGIFSDKYGSSELFNINWKSRKSRSRGKLNQPSPSRPLENIELKVDKVSVGKRDDNTAGNEKKIIYYSRRRKRKPDYSTGAGAGVELVKHDLPREDCSVSCQVLDVNGGSKSEINLTSESAGLFPTMRQLEMQTTCIVGVGQEDQHQILEESNLDGGCCSLVACASSQKQSDIELIDRTSENGEISLADKCCRYHDGTACDRFVENTGAVKEICHPLSEGHREELAERYDVVSVANSASSHSAQPSAGRFDPGFDDFAVEKSCVNGGDCSHLTSDNEVKQEMEATCRENYKEENLCDDSLINKPHLGSEDVSGALSLGDGVQQGNNTSSGSQVEHFLSSTTLTKGPSTISVEKRFEVPREPCTAADSCDGALSKNQAEKEIPNGSKKGVLSGSITPVRTDQPTTLSEGVYSVLSENTCAKEDMHTDVTLDVQVLQQTQATKGTSVDEVMFCSNSPMKGTQLSPTVLEACSKVQRESSDEEKSCHDATADDDRHGKDLIRNEINEEEPVSCLVTPINRTKTVPIQKYSRTRREGRAAGDMNNVGAGCLSVENRELESAAKNCKSSLMSGIKRRREVEETLEQVGGSGFIRSPCEGLRPRARKDATSGIDVGKTSQEMLATKETTKPSIHTHSKKITKKGSHRCDLEGCHMSFETKEELRLHKRNRCPYEGCGKKFRSHKYAILHQRVHEDNRPLKCPWKGCSMSFKWAWARTEHIRVHTGERPYQCKVEGCGLSFRFVSDFSRHRRKTGHYVDSA